MSDKYKARSLPRDEKAHIKLGPENADVRDKVKIYTDGTVEVTNLKETSGDGLSYGLSEKRDNFNLSYDLDSNTSVKFVPKNVDKVYCTTLTKSFSIKNAFAVYKNNVRKFVTKNLTRYKTAPKPLKKEIDKILKNKNEYIFTEEKGDEIWNQVYVDSTTFGPYNYDVNITATKDINFINDLIVIRTGSARLFYDRGINQNVTVAGQSNVVWVSPHNTYDFSGQGSYVSSGQEITSRIANSGIFSGSYFWGKSYGVTNNYSSYALSSKHVVILKDTTFRTSMAYTDISDSTAGGVQRTSKLLTDQPFYNLYPTFTLNSPTGEWDGVIPSGHPIEIQTWSTNPRYIGFDGEISIKPVDSTKADNINLNCDITCTSEHTDYQVSVRQAINKAKSKFYKMLNLELVKNGIKNKSSKRKHYEKLLERIAQDVYDGLGYIRNENVAKVQGLESNPLDSPIYYDGTSLEYGGSEDNLSYGYNSEVNPLKTKTDSTSTSSSSSSSSSAY